MTQFRDNSWSRVFFFYGRPVSFSGLRAFDLVSYSSCVPHADGSSSHTFIFRLERIRIFLSFVLFFFYSSFLFVFFFIFLPDAKTHADPIAARNCFRPLLIWHRFSGPFLVGTILLHNNRYIIQ